MIDWWDRANTKSSVGRSVDRSEASATIAGIMVDLEAPAA
jgi:hypothetical protein